MRHTYTYALLAVSKTAYDEIRAKLDAAGYADQFHGERIDMHGIALVIAPEKCGICNATMARCNECGHEWCGDHGPAGLSCPNCKARP